MIVLKNLNQILLRIRDLGVFLKINEEVSLDEMFSSEEILKSKDLENLFLEEGFSLKINGSDRTYTQLVDFLTRMSKEEHTNLVSMAHNLTGNMFFQTNKNINGQTEYITYFKDDTKQEKIREEHIIRDQQGRVSSIIVSLYQDNVLLYQTTQVMNRGVAGTVENIVFIEE